jgi:hypothetical protein
LPFAPWRSKLDIFQEFVAIGAIFIVDQANDDPVICVDVDANAHCFKHLACVLLMIYARKRCLA